MIYLKDTTKSYGRITTISFQIYFFKFEITYNVRYFS